MVIAIVMAVAVFGFVAYKMIRNYKDRTPRPENNVPGNNPGKSDRGDRPDTDKKISEAQK